MRKIDLIIESIRDEYMINLLEEGSVSELESLKTKKFLNENLNRIRKMLVEEGALDGVKNHLANNWGKYLGGAGALGAGALAANHFMGDGADPRLDEIVAAGDENQAIRDQAGSVLPEYMKGQGGQAGMDDARQSMIDAQNASQNGEVLIPGQGNAMVDKAVQYTGQQAADQATDAAAAQAAREKFVAGGYGAK